MKKDQKVKTSVKKSKKKNEKSETQELDKWLKEFIEKHDDALRELAKR